jgi:hypothetical protein
MSKPSRAVRSKPGINAGDRAGVRAAHRQDELAAVRVVKPIFKLEAVDDNDHVELCWAHRASSSWAEHAEASRRGRLAGSAVTRRSPSARWPTVAAAKSNGFSPRLVYQGKTPGTFEFGSVPMVSKTQLMVRRRLVGQGVPTSCSSGPERCQRPGDLGSLWSRRMAPDAPPISLPSPMYKNVENYRR